MIKKIHIDLNQIDDKQSLFQIFAQAFSFPSHFGYNWDALYDTLNSITTETDIVQYMRYPLDGLHLIFDHFDGFRAKFPSQDFDIFTRLLIDISQVPKKRSGDVTYTFEIR
jgi:RNAse (barnase) inhibitor barstar